MGKNIIKTQVKKSNKIIEEMSLSEVNKGLIRLRNKGFKPFFKGTGSGRVKLGFED